METKTFKVDVLTKSEMELLSDQELSKRAMEARGVSFLKGKKTNAGLTILLGLILTNPKISLIEEERALLMNYITYIFED